jgi:predicted glutamine amidotransferase
MNVLLSDGETLFCYRDVRGHKGLTWRCIAGLSSDPAHLEDQDLKVDLKGVDYNHGIVVATCPLSGSDWCDVGLGELLVFRQGRLMGRRQFSGSMTAPKLSAVPTPSELAARR